MFSYVACYFVIVFAANVILFHEMQTKSNFFFRLMRKKSNTRLFWSMMRGMGSHIFCTFDLCGVAVAVGRPGRGMMTIILMEKNDGDRSCSS